MSSVNSLTYNPISRLESSISSFQNMPHCNVMTKICLLALLIFPVLSNMAANDTNANFHLSGLDFRQRPPAVQEAVSEAFEQLARSTTSNWYYNGDHGQYWTLNINEYQLFLEMMKEAPLSQTHFYALDLGAGQFGWGKGLLRFLQNHKDVNLNKTVHIIGVRGEQYANQETTQVHQIGGFKIEELSLEFPKRGLFLENKVDLIVSRWCFRHLIDPLGTFIQAYNLLRPERGVALMTGFFILLNQEYSPKSSNSDLNLVRFLLATKAPFLTSGMLDTGLMQFILKRPDFKPGFLEMSYAEILGDVGNPQTVFLPISRYYQAPQKEAPKINWPRKTESFHGDKNLYTWLSTRDLFYKSSLIGPYERHPIVKEEPTSDLIQLDGCKN